METIKCKYCGSTDLKKSDQNCAGGLVHLRVDCNQCGKFQKWEKRIKNDEFTMPYGKYKGKKISEIVELDKDYSVWMSENCTSNNIKNRFKSALKREEVLR